MKEAKGLLLMLAGVAAFITILGFLTQSGGNLPFLRKPAPTPITKTIKVAGEEVQAYVANTDAKRQKGLSGRESLGDNQGMLFVFEKPDTQPSFWMKDMKIAIDILWIDNDQIVQIDKNVQPPQDGAKDSELKLY